MKTLPSEMASAVQGTFPLLLLPCKAVASFSRQLTLLARLTFQTPERGETNPLNLQISLRILVL